MMGITRQTRTRSHAVSFPLFVVVALMPAVLVFPFAEQFARAVERLPGHGSGAAFIWGYSLWLGLCVLLWGKQQE